MTTLDQAIAQMRANGMPEFPPGHPKVGIGRITRYGPKKAAWYRLEVLRTRGNREVIVGAFGYWGKLEPTKIDVDWKGISAEERAELETRAKETERIEREKRQDRAQRAANRALEQWRGGLTAEQLRAWLVEHQDAERPLSPYLERKGVAPEACRFFTDGTVLVPMLHYDSSDGAKLAGLQKIAPDGAKRFNKGMAMEGAACRIGAPPKDGDVILIAEGYATGLSLREATMQSLPIFLAFNAGNLKPVAERLRARYPLSPFIFCADDDWKTKAMSGEPWNPGVEYAQNAARAAGYSWVIRPLFAEASREEKWTDFNDLHLALGIDVLRQQLNLQEIMSATPAIMAPGQSLVASPEDREIAAALTAIREWREDAAEGSGGGGSGAPPDGPATPSTPGGGDAPRPRKWYDDLQKGKDFSVKPTVYNAVLYLSNHDAWKGVLGYDTFSETVVKMKAPPYPGGEKGEWSELDDHRLLLWFSRRIGELGTEAIQKAVQLAAHRSEFNPLRQRLDALERAHDGKARLRTWLIDYLGVNVDGLREQLAIAEAAKTKDPAAIRSLKDEIDRTLKYVELVATKWMIGAVARVYQPGCRVDYMLILEGDQGVKKSTTIEILGGEWYTDARLNFADKDSLLIVQGRWIIEMAELEGMNKAETSETKKFLTQHIDLFRPPYGRKLVKYPRRCVFAGTVNLDAYLKDDSGNRRFWPVRVTAIDAEALRRDIDLLWGEAVKLYKAGTPWWVLADERHLFAEQQDQRFAVDAWEDRIIDYLDGLGEFAMEQGMHNRTTIPDLLGKALKLDMARWDKPAQLRVVGILRRRGWVRRRDAKPPRQWYYARPPEPLPQKSHQPPKDQDDPRDRPF